MSSNFAFQNVSYKRSRRPKNIDNRIDYSAQDAFVDIEKIIKRVLDATIVLENDDFMFSFKSDFAEALEICQSSNITEIICFGLGSLLNDSLISKYQLAVVLQLKQLLKCMVKFYDPAFTPIDVQILSKLDCQIVDHNLEGKYTVNGPTLFYLPHCPKQLSNNLLWANWGPNISNCFVLANSFNSLIETSLDKEVDVAANYIKKILPYCVEFTMNNWLQHEEVFNDTALHCFPLKELKRLDGMFWTDNEEPTYPPDSEFVQAKRSNNPDAEHT